MELLVARAGNPALRGLVNSTVVKWSRLNPFIAVVPVLIGGKHRGMLRAPREGLIVATDEALNEPKNP